MAKFAPKVLRQWLSLIQPNERVAVSLAFAWFFLVMFSYQLLRPIRESLASELDKQEKSWLFIATFICMMVAVPLYAKLVTIFKRRQLILTVFGLFSLTILAFSFWNQQVNPQLAPTIQLPGIQADAVVASSAIQAGPPSIMPAKAWMIRVFFVWVSVFALYATSLVWSVLIDIFSSEQGKRLFGLIAGGATAGAITASTLAISAEKIGTNKIMWLSAGILASSCFLALSIELVTRSWPSGERTPPVEGGMFAGIGEIIKSRYLTQMILFIALISIFGGMIYMRLTDEAKREISDYEQRTSYFAKLNLYVQLGTLFVQSVLIGPAMRRLGLSVTLSLLPVVAAACFSSMYFRSDLMMLGIVDVISRIATYGFSVPSREVLFTVVSREAKYKAKNIIDTIVIRGSDALSSTLYGSAMHFMAFSTLCLFILPLAGLWYGIAIWLGRRQAWLAQRQAQPPSTVTN